MDYVYLLWQHGEDGPEDLVATLDRLKVINIAKSLDVNDWFARVTREGELGVIETLEEVLRLSDEELAVRDHGITGLMHGWGGLHFQVVKLQ